MSCCFVWVCVSVNVFPYSTVSYTFTPCLVLAIGIFVICRENQHSQYIH